MNDERDEIRRRVDIVSLVSREVNLRRTGKNYQGLCPFHDDKNPSMTVSPATGRYRCWSCGAHGDVFTWIMERRKVDFPEAMRLLAKEAGIEIKPRDPEAAARRAGRQDLLELASVYFRDQLARSPLATDYLRSRRLGDEVVKHWELGFAPENGEALPTHLRRQNVSLGEAKELFLLDQDDSGGYYAKYRRRLMFPIRDDRGTLVAFGGRLLGDAKAAKYINASDTPLYRKSRVLYGFHHARPHIADARRAVLCEGYLDVIAAHEAGVTTAVASLGTALTEEQTSLLKRWCDEVVVLYDADEAGAKAADRAADVLAAGDLRALVAQMPEGEDPDSLLRTRGPNAVREVVEAAVSPATFRVARLEKAGDPAQEAFWTDLAEILSHVPNELELDRHLVRLAPQYPGVRDPFRAVQALRRMVGQRRRARREGREGERAVLSRPKLPPLNANEVVVFRAYAEEPIRRQAALFARNPNFFATDTGVRLAAAILQAFGSQTPEGPLRAWIHRIEDAELGDILGQVLDDPRVPVLDEATVTEAVGKLRELAAQRRDRASLLEADDTSERAKIYASIFSRKGIRDEEDEEDPESLY